MKGGYRVQENAPLYLGRKVVAVNTAFTEKDPHPNLEDLFLITEVKELDISAKIC